MRVAQLAAQAIQHLHTAQTVLHPGRRLRVRWIEDTRGARVEMARIRMSLRTNDGTTLPEYIDITSIPMTKSAHEAIAAHQARDTLLASMEALGRAWFAHPVLGPMANYTGTPERRQVGFILTKSGNAYSLHLDLGAATWTPEHADTVGPADLLAAIGQAEDLTVDEAATGALVLASIEPALCHAQVLGQPNAWALLTPFTCPDTQPRIWRLEQRIGLEDIPYAKHGETPALTEAWKALFTARSRAQEPVYDSVVAVWDGERVRLGPSLETAKLGTGLPKGTLHSILGHRVVEAAETFLTTLVATVPVCAGDDHSPRPWIELAVKRNGPGFQYPVFGAFGRVHHNVEDCAALAEVAHGPHTWMAVRDHDRRPRAIFAAATLDGAVTVADRLRETDTVDLYRRVDATTS